MANECDFPRCPARALFNIAWIAGSLDACRHHARELSHSLDTQPGILTDLDKGTTEAFGPELVPVAVPA